MGEVHPFQPPVRRPRYPQAVDSVLACLADDGGALVALIEQAGLDDRQARAAIRTLCRHMREATR